MLLGACVGEDTTPAATEYRIAVQRTMAQYRVPGAVVAVRVPGEAEWREGFGVGDAEHRVPIDPDAYFSICSLTKSMTVTLILQLVRDQAIGLDDPISRYVPGIPNGDRITLSQLAGMASGVKNYTLVGPELQRIRMSRSRAATSGPKYGRYGLGIGQLDGWWGHTGEALGFQAAVFREPASGAVIAVLLNSSQTDNVATEIFQAVAGVVARR